MRTARVIGPTVVLGMLMGGGVLARDGEGTRNSALTCAMTHCIAGGEPVLGAAFSAEATVTWYPRAGASTAPLQATSRYYRDHAGRLRVEQTFAGDASRVRRIVLMPDPDDRSAYLIDPVARTVTAPFPRGMAEMMLGGVGWNLFLIPLSPNRFWVFHQVPLADPEAIGVAAEEPLGSRSIADVPANGTRFSTKLPAGIRGTGRAERWVSPELKLVVYSRSEDDAVGIVEYRLTKIDRAEPRPELFGIPEDYDVTERLPEGHHVLTWQNAYFPRPTQSSR